MATLPHLVSRITILLSIYSFSFFSSKEDKKRHLLVILKKKDINKIKIRIKKINNIFYKNDIFKIFLFIIFLHKTY